MTHEEAECLRRRERQERAAAKAVLNTTARQAHQHLAECYAALLNGLTFYERLAIWRREGVL